MNKDAVFFKYKTLMDNLISNNIKEGLEALIKLDCKLVTNYLNSVNFKSKCNTELKSTY